MKMTDRTGIVLTLESGPALFGQGEAAPLPGYSDESLQDAERALTRLDAGRVAHVLELAAEPEWGLSLERELESLVPRRVPSARFALESAVFDLVARRKGRTQHELLRAHLESSPAVIQPIDRAALVELEPSLTEAAAALAAGFKTLKLKVGARGRFEEERALLCRLRALAGPGIALRLDANRSFAGEVARENLNALSDLAIEFIEEPTPAGTEWLDAPAVGVALDESLRSAAALDEKIVRRCGLVALVLKPSVLGGLLHCQKLARRARELGLSAVISHAFEGPVGFATLLELALALGPDRFAHGLGPHVGLSAWPESPALARQLPRWAPHSGLGNGLARLALGAEGSPC